jgi:hypothetical protein
MTTIQDIYAAINPLPAMLSAKGKIKPEVVLHIEANAGFNLFMSWDKRHASYSYEREYKSNLGDNFQQVLGKAIEFINEMPSAEQAKLHDFMGKLGKLIDAGKADGIEVDYLNPLLDSMKRLSENIITYQPKKAQSSSRVSQEERS